MGDAGIEMGKRPSRQRRHLPTAVTSAATTRATTKQNIPLLKMSFREPCQENKTTTEAEKEVIGTTTGYNAAPINSSIGSNRRKRVKTTTTKTKYGYDNNELKKRTQEFINTNNSKKKKIVVWMIVIFWILFMLYRIIASYKNDDFNYLSIMHVFSK